MLGEISKMKKLDKFFEVYNEEKQKNKKIFNFPYMLCCSFILFIYSIGMDRFGEKPIYHVFVVGILYIFSECWKNYKQKK